MAKKMSGQRHIPLHRGVNKQTPVAAGGMDPRTLATQAAIAGERAKLKAAHNKTVLQPPRMPDLGPKAGNAQQFAAPNVTGPGPAPRGRGGGRGRMF